MEKLHTFHEFELSPTYMYFVHKKNLITLPQFLNELLWDTLYFPEILDIEHMHRLLALSYTFPC